MSQNRENGPDRQSATSSAADALWPIREALESALLDPCVKIEVVDGFYGIYVNAFCEAKGRTLEEALIEYQQRLSPERMS